MIVKFHVTSSGSRGFYKRCNLLIQTDLLVTKKSSLMQADGKFKSSSFVLSYPHRLGLKLGISDGITPKSDARYGFPVGD